MMGGRRMQTHPFRHAPQDDFARRAGALERVGVESLAIVNQNPLGTVDRLVVAHVRFHGRAVGSENASSSGCFEKRRNNALLTRNEVRREGAQGGHRLPGGEQ